VAAQLAVSQEETQLHEVRYKEYGWILNGDLKVTYVAWSTLYE
jgi:hypothetical protein